MTKTTSNAFRALIWACVGAAVTFVVIADPMDIHPLDSWITQQTGADRSAGHDVVLWTCGMHPEVISEEPGTCPICEMNLTPMNAQSVPAGPLFTCPMHPEILSDDPDADCPICFMDLVPVKAQSEPDGHDHGVPTPVVTIDSSVVQNMNLTTARVERSNLSRRIRTVGHLDYDEHGMVSVTTRYAGFVEKVHVHYVGQEVKKGEALFEIYAPELVQTQQELLSALNYARSLRKASPEARDRAAKLVEAARTRLDYWQITPSQIERVEASGKVMRTLTVPAPAGGMVMKTTHGLEGSAVRPGEDVIHIVDLDPLRLTVEIYEDQLAWIGPGATARITFDAVPGRSTRGTVRLIEPEVSPQTRSVRLTLEVPNPGNRLRVGMYATVLFEPVAARNALVVPAQAVIRSGERDIIVLVRGQGRFQPQEVELGLESQGRIQVLEGVAEGDEIVTSAHFLIDSESNLQAAVQKMLAGRKAGS